MPSPILFFLEFSSPYAYIAAHKIEDVAEKHGRTVSWKAISLAHVWRAIDYERKVPKEKLRYLIADWSRFAALEGLPFTMPEVFPIDAKLARLAYYRLEARDPALARRFALAALSRYWGEGADIQTAEQLAGVAAGLKIDPAEITAAAEDAEAKKQVFAATNLAVEKGLFGTPFFVVDDQSFWGADRIDHLDRWLSRSSTKAA